MSLELVPPRPGVPASISEATIRKARATLRQSNIRVILGGVGLLSGSTGGSSTEVGRIYSCSVSKQVSGETCILYFSRNLTEKVSTIRDVLRSVKPVPDNQIVYVDPKTLTPNAQDLLRMSGLDVAVFLGDN